MGTTPCTHRRWGWALYFGMLPNGLLVFLLREVIPHSMTFSLWGISLIVLLTRGFRSRATWCHLCFLLINIVIKITSLNEILNVLLELMPVFGVMLDVSVVLLGLSGSPLIHRYFNQWWPREELFFLDMVQDLSFRCIPGRIFTELAFGMLI